MPRVILVSRIFSPEIGAAAFRLRELALAFADNGHEVVVLTAKPPASAGAAEDAHLEVRRWPVLRDSSGTVRGYFQYLSFDLPLFLRLLSSPRADMYVCEPPPTTGVVVRLLSTALRRPYAYYAADVWSDGAVAVGAPRLVVTVLRMLEVWCLRGAAVVLAVSPEMGDRLRVLAGESTRVVVVGNGVDISSFNPRGAVRTLPAPFFVYAGTMSEWQGCEVFIYGLAEHRRRGGRSRAIFLGQGSELAKVRDLAERLIPGAVQFLGVQSPEVTACWLRGAAAALVAIRPGAGYDLARPTKVYAATACGTPVIFAGTSAGRQLVNEAGLGWAVDHDPTAVANAMDVAVSVDAAGVNTRPSTEHLEQWTRRNASLRSCAETAVTAVAGYLAR